jgi:hypothetical protein
VVGGGGSDEQRGDAFRVSRMSDDVIRIDWVDDIDIDEKNAAAALTALEACSDGIALPLLVDVRTMRSISRGARKQFAQTAVASRVALVVGSSLSKTVANFFLGLTSTKVPVRLFDDEPTAMAWLGDADE